MHCTVFDLKNHVPLRHAYDYVFCKCLPSLLLQRAFQPVKQNLLTRRIKTGRTKRRRAADLCGENVQHFAQQAFFKITTTVITLNHCRSACCLSECNCSEFSLSVSLITDSRHKRPLPHFKCFVIKNPLIINEDTSLAPYIVFL